MDEHLLARYDVAVAGDRAWQRRLRLLQSVWRFERGLQPGTHPRASEDARVLGSRLAMPEAEQDLANYLTPTIREVLRAELSEAAGEGKLFSAPRIYDDLLSSQPLCFNLFAELKADLGLASRWARHLWPDRVTSVDRIEFEHSPGRGDERYLGNRTAFDVYLEHRTTRGGRGFIGIEVKYHESLAVGRADNRGRPAEVARDSGAFSASSLEVLDQPPLQQVWFDHLLALSMLGADAATWETGLFVFLHPAANEAAYRVVNAYETHLVDRSSFQRLTLEEAVAALQMTVGQPWVTAFRDRYLAYEKVDQL